jgi:hypothetical protein
MKEDWRQRRWKVPKSVAGNAYDHTPNEEIREEQNTENRNEIMEWLLRMVIMRKRRSNRRRVVI